MTNQIQSEIPSNIREFNEIAGVIFARLYQAFPVSLNLDRNWIAQSLGHQMSDKLPSGRPFNEVLIHTGHWLLTEGFILTGALGDPSS
jgi:hypothetical protein